MTKSLAQTRKEADERAKAYRAKYAILNALPLTDEEKKRWVPFLHATWSAIAGDVAQCCAESGQRMTKDVIVEMTIDANRPEMFSGMTHDEYEFLCVASHRPAVQRWLRKELNY